MVKGGYTLIKRGELRAVLDSDLDQYLESLGCRDVIIKGEARCVFCGRPVTPDNLHALFPYKDQVGFCCDESECILRLASEGRIES